MSKEKVQRNFRPWESNQERLVFAEEKLGLHVPDLINEVLEKHLKNHIEGKAKKLREALSVPVP
jgi:hypothetical protein